MAAVRGTAVGRLWRCVQGRATDRFPSAWTYGFDPLLSATVCATAGRCTLKADIDRHPGAATKFSELSFDSARRRLTSGAGRTTAAQGLELALSTLQRHTLP